VVDNSFGQAFINIDIIENSKNDDSRQYKSAFVNMDAVYYDMPVSNIEYYYGEENGMGNYFGVILNKIDKGTTSLNCDLSN
jgi:hypothetical protein